MLDISFSSNPLVIMFPERHTGLNLNHEVCEIFMIQLFVFSVRLGKLSLTNPY